MSTGQWADTSIGHAHFLHRCIIQKPYFTMAFSPEGSILASQRLNEWRLHIHNYPDAM